MFNFIISLIFKMGIGPLFNKFILPWFQDLDVKALTEKIGLSKIQGLILSVLILIIVVLAVRSNGLVETNEKLQIVSQNIESLTDSVSYERNKAGELEAIRLSLISDADNLVSLNQDLADELKKEKGKVSSLSRTLATVSRDTVYLTNTVLVDTSSAGLVKYEFSWRDAGTFGKSSRFIEGTTFVEMADKVIKSNTAITKDYLELFIVQGIRLNNDGKYESFIRSDYPGITFDTRSAILDLRKEETTKKWGIGIGLGYDFLNKGPSLHLGIQRNLIRF